MVEKNLKGEQSLLSNGRFELEPTESWTRQCHWGIHGWALLLYVFPLISPPSRITS